MPTLQDGRDAINEGNLQQARLIFQALLQENARDEEAWLGLAEVVTDEDDKRVCYENVLKINKNNRAAKDGLRSLEPKEDPLVAALAGQSFDSEDEEAAWTDEPPDYNDEPTFAAPTDSEPSETPTAVLVAVGLALSVVVFALFGGIIFFALTSFAGG
ncbi:MAG: hypothetical protein KDF65_00440 [Anaerolineae bacterium]|nr:hypothetical protein [Anaerolineae bacterium]